MFKIVHLVTGVAALLLSLMPSLKTDALPLLQQPDAVYLALLGLLNLVWPPSCHFTTAARGNNCSTWPAPCWWWLWCCRP